MSTIEKAIEKLAGKNSVAGQGDAALPGQSIESTLKGSGRAALDSYRSNGITIAVLDRLRERGMLVPGSSSIQMLEEYRRIKRPILMNIANNPDQENANLIMVTSSSPAEGKTFTSINLAVSVAMELDKTALLVDADIHKPAASDILGVGDRPGLVDVLSSEDLDVASVLLKTDIPSLSLFPVGKERIDANELLSSNAMAALMKELAHRYHDRVIIIDTPPILVANEAAVLSNLVGQVVVVVEAEKTRKTLLDEALSSITLRNKSVGLVLNKNRIRPDKYSYYGSYAVAKK